MLLKLPDNSDTLQPVKTHKEVYAFLDIQLIGTVTHLT